MRARVKLALHNIEDAEAYVHALLPRVALTSEMREELVQEGLLLLQQLERKYKPGLGGRDPSGSTFTGYLEGQHFKQKLRERWHRLEGGQLSTSDAGGRRWVYPPKPASLDQLQEREGGTDNVRALQDTDIYETDLAVNLAKALDEQWQLDRDLTIKVGVLLGDGISPSAIAEQLGHREKTIVAAVQRIVRIAPRLTIMEAA